MIPPTATPGDPAVARRGGAGGWWAWSSPVGVTPQTISPRSSCGRDLNDTSGTKLLARIDADKIAAAELLAMVNTVDQTRELVLPGQL
jgi:hypothetical protein